MLLLLQEIFEDIIMECEKKIEKKCAKNLINEKRLFYHQSVSSAKKLK